MAKVKTKGLTETMKMFEQLTIQTDDIMKDVVKAGSAVTTDTMRTEIKALKTSGEYASKKGKRYPAPVDVEGLLDSLGYTPVDEKGTIFNANVGFDGYNSHKTKKYPNGHANRMIANAINKGTSFLHAQPFINRTRKQAQDKCVNEMQKELDKAIKKISK